MDGQANEAVVLAVADALQVSKTCVEVVRGLKSKHKMLEISAVPPMSVETAWARFRLRCSDNDGA